ncbi:MutS-related protein [Poritiphilus flavus]|uniref:DNA mismatch repair protein MutS n=1 Tax=Poritiphilus flavus TaxID=2697053 RepID=A0A6L9E6S9_9FLAO|nr:DNA mismatch repair protein MutS [Poritiphilus flavus]NAS10447.1 DNA mismatch repair protein MutS [Poritiphilus flavus]
MQHPEQFYKQRITQCEQQLAAFKKRLFAIGMLRLSVFLFAVFGGYFFFDQKAIFFLLILGCLAIFIYLVSRHADLKYLKDKWQKLLHINRQELKVLKRKFHHLPDGAEFANPKHHFSSDIDLFGRGSFYQYCNRTALKLGSESLAKILTENNIDRIPDKQRAIEELSALVEWRQEFSAAASMIKAETTYDIIVNWMRQYTSFVPAAFRWIPFVFGTLSAGIITAYSFDLISGWGLAAWFFLGLGISGQYLKKINKLSADTSKVLSTFQQYEKLTVMVEKQGFEAKWLQEKQALVLREGETASGILKRFSRLLNALDQRNNIIIGILANAFMLRDLWLSLKIENWIKGHAAEVEDWFRAIAFFDANISLGNFAFNHPEYHYPKITDSEILLKTTEAAHPLLDPQRRITNDVEIRKGQFFIITGANMAGKSTFLRTIGLQIVMGNIGLPLCAGASTYSPIRLISSMRTTDSLTDDESYFFSELKRLKFIVDEIAGDQYFVLLDEILKGTNSTDKARGSRKFVEQLVRSGSTGMIATHDLSLCGVAEDYKEMANYYFDAEIKNDELHFDYKFKEGICQNMNASFLLKKMKVIE